MKISIVIPTINRDRDLQRLLESIKNQKCKASEIIIVDQGNVKKTKDLLTKFFGDNTTYNIKILIQKEASLVKARNKGWQKAKGDIILFLDDDTEIEPDYICTLIDLAKKHKDSFAFAGIFDSAKKNSFVKRLLGYMFCVSKLGEKRNVILRSGHNIMRANYSSSPVYVEWLSGLNMAYRKKVFDDGLSFFEGFSKYSLGEDVMFSYSVFKRYGEQSILIHPNLKVVHHESQTGRLRNLQLLKMRIIYKYILWSKLIKNEKAFSLPCYLISELFMGIYYILKSENKKSAIISSLSAYKYLFKNRKSILQGTVNYNDFIFS